MQGVNAASVSSIADVLSQRASLTPEKLAYAWLQEGAIVGRLNYRELDAKARSIAAHLRARAATGPVLLFYPSGLDFVAAFFGCLYAGLICVPLYTPGRRRFDSRLAAIMGDARPGFGLTCSSALPTVQAFSAQQGAGASLPWLATDLLPAAPLDGTGTGAGPCPAAERPATAYLQYTSGSTSTPKGVMVGQHGLLQTLQDLDHGWLHDADSAMVTWLPLFHDMGLIYGLLQPMYGGFPCYLMEPMAFLQRPLRWLEAISRFGGTHTAAPNFAYDLCVRNISEGERKALDLSRWKVALNAAEPVRLGTMQSFTQAFAPSGFDPLTFCPGYGLAESSLKVTAVRRGAGTTVLALGAQALAAGRVQVVADTDAQARVFVGCGHSGIGAHIAIVDPSDCTEAGAGRVGEIWVRSGSLGQGYWLRPQVSQQTFGARLAPGGEGPFLRTGDLGFLHEGELFITGRVKDLIIVRGANHYPQDIELTVERSHALLNPGASAAFALDVDGEEKLVIAQELSRKGLRLEQSDAVVQAIRAAVAREHDLSVHAVVLLRPASIPKTSSGKIQRSACRSGFEAGTLSVVAQWREPAPAGTDTAAHAAPPAAQVPGSLRPWLLQRLARHAGVSASALDARAPFASLGLDSLAAVRLSDELGQRLGRVLSPTIVFEYPTPDALVRHLEPSSAAGHGARPETPQAGPGEPIAVVGVGCRFPQGPDVESFWQSLVEGVDSVSPAPAGRWAPDERPLPPGHFVEGVDAFDADFFGIAPREAERMDPQQRLLLEVACEAIEDAGLTGLAGSRTGVFIGISTSDYARRLLDPAAQAGAYAGTGGALSIAANRLSYCLDLRGPSWAVDTACSSSLVAVHQAAQALRLGQCEVALAGGVNVMAAPELTRALGEAHMLSADGRCKTFDASADGYGRGEGCAVVVLKRLRDALRDGDRPLALVLGTAVNQDGRSNGLTAPNGLAQQQVIRSALADAGIAPAEVGYVEAHGTGTPLGDPIEVQALQAVLAQDRGAEQPCWIGSVKTAIGHLEAAAGIAGLVKTVLALEREELPAHRNLQALNPHLRLHGTPFSIPTARQPWPRGPRRRIGGVSSFGFGGTNAHVILAEAPSLPAAAQPGEPPRSHHVLTLSAQSPQALAAQALRLGRHLAGPGQPPLADLCFTSNTRRTHHRCRAAWTAEDLPALQQALARFAAEPDGGHARAGQAGATAAPLAMLFTGQGAQARDMGLALYRGEPVFRRVVDECDALLRQTLTPSLREAWFGPAGEALLHETAYTQPALYTLEVALAQLWRSWGVEPAAVMGHSVGEFAAAAVAGVFSVEDGLRLVAARGRLMQALPRQGRMVALAAGHARVLELLGGDAAGVSVAAVNGPRNTVISGPSAAVQAVVERCVRLGVGATPLRTSHAFHSPLMQPMLDAFTDVVAGMRLQPPALAVISNLTGEVAGPEISTPAYWRRHVSDPVLFAAGMSALARQGCRTFLEVGPAPVLLGMGRQTLTGEDFTWLPSLRPGVADMRQMLDSLGARHVQGGAVDWAAVHANRPHRGVRMPTYAFQRQRYWLPAGKAAAPAAAEAYELQWQPAPAAPVTPPAPGGWLLLAEPGGLGGALAQALQAQGHHCLRLGREALDGAPAVDALRAPLEAFTRQLGERGLPLHGAVQLWAAQAAGDAASCAGVQADLLAAVAVMRLLARHTAGVPARLWLATRSAVPAGGQAQAPRLADAALWGLGRGLAAEQPRHFGGLVDLEPTPGAQDAAQLLSELLGADGEAEAAWREGARHVPRLVRAAALPAAVPALRADASYLVTGGCGFVGLEIAAWLVRHGATRLVLSSRRAADNPCVDALRAQGAQVLVVAADVAEPAGVQHLLGEIAAAGLPPLRGIVHAAGVGEPRALAELDAAAVAQALRPKLDGTLLLEAHTAALELDFFVCLSSIASVWGGKGVAHYAAANHVLDAWAHGRRARGLPALTLNCGPWAGGGMAFGNDRLGLEHSGIAPLGAERYLAALSSLLAHRAGAQVLLAQVDWPVLCPLYEARGRGRLLQALATAPAARPAPARPALREQLRAAAPAQQRPLVLEHVRREVAAVLGFAADKPFSATEGFFQLGMDSLMAVELRNRLAAALGQPLPAALVFDAPNVQALATALLGLVQAEAQAAQAPAPAAPAGPADAALSVAGAASDGAAADPIAIVGLACRFPGGADEAQSFWALQREGIDAIGPVPAGRWDADACYDPEGRAPGTAYTREGGFIAGVDLFDAQYFGISPREAAEMDPQHRLVLELSHEALENAGHAFHTESGARTGVFLGLTHSDYAQMLLAEGQGGRIGPYAITGSSPNAAAGRVSYALRLKGPALTVDTACSSSLVAVDLACRSLRERECDAALAGGVNLILSPAGTIAACQAQMLSADGRCKTFDAAADGYGRGEGAGLVVLKRLSDAVASGDRIWALVLGSAVNHDGRSSGFTVPSGPAQQAVIRAALARAGVAPAEVGYVEAHGTGTALGDPIEAGALGAVFADSHRDAALVVGSVKGNIGHLESAAGIAGLIRAALVVHHGEIPRLPRLATPNPEIDWQGLALRAARQHERWSAGGPRRIAGVSSFGVSGTNAHAVLAEPPAQAPQAPPRHRGAHLLALSARTAEALRALAGALARHLAQQPALSIEDVCHTLGGRARHAVRAAWRVSCTEEACRVLLDCAQGAHGEPVLEAPKLCWVFGDAAEAAEAAGQAAAVRELYDTQPTFRQALDALQAPAAGLLPASPARMLGGEDAAGLSHPAWRAALGFALQHALSRMWRAQGVAPDTVLALGSGAWAAACDSGAMQPADALRACAQGAAQDAADQACARAGQCACLGADAPAPAVDAALAGMRCEGAGLFLEMGLVRNSRLQAAGERLHALGGRWLGASAPGRSAWEGVVDALAALHLAGAEPQLRGPQREGRVVTLPTYPFQRRRYWLEDAPVAAVAAPPRRPQGHGTPPLPGRRVRAAAAARESIEFAATVDAARIPFLAGHRLFGTAVLPSSLYVEMALSAAQAVLGEGPLSLHGYRIGQPGALDPALGRELHIVLRGDGADRRSFEIVGMDPQAADADEAWTLHAQGTVQRLDGQALPSLPPLAAVQARLDRPVAVAGFYGLLRRHGLDIAPRFHALRRLWAHQGEALGEIALEPALQPHEAWRAEPVVLDACFQLAGAALDSLGAATQAHLQVGMERFTWLAPCGRGAWAHLRLHPRSPARGSAVRADLWIYAADGQPVALAQGLELSPAGAVEPAAAPEPADPQGLLYRIEWAADPGGACSPMPAARQLAGVLAAQRDAWQSQPALTDYGAASAAVDALCARLAAQALQALGWPAQGGAADALEPTLRQRGIAPRHGRLVRQLLDMRAAPDGAWSGTLGGTLGGADPAEPPAALFDAVRRAHPSARAELALLERTSAHLVDVLRGAADPNDVLFPNGDLGLVTGLYEASPVAAMMNALVGRAVAEVVAGWAEGRPLRVLEIGAGTGATTAAILQHLPAQQAEYVYTDIDDRFLDAAARRFAAYPFVRFERLNIDDDPAAQGLDVGRFDIVVAANVLHTAPRLERSLRHARRLLAPAGLLVLLEGTAPLRLFDLTFGLTEGWWRFADDPARPHYPLASVPQWQALLQAQGFEGFSHVSSQDARWPALPLQSLMTARAAAGQAAGARPGHWLLCGDAQGLGGQLAALLRERGDTASLMAHPGTTKEACRNELQRALVDSGAPLRGVVHLAALDARLQAEPDAAALQAAVEVGCRGALALAQALAEGAAGQGTPLWLVTRGAMAAGGPAQPLPVAGLAQAPLWGLGKVLASEHAELPCRLVDLDADGDSRGDAARLLQELDRCDGETRVAQRGAQRLVARLARAEPRQAGAAAAAPVRADRAYLVTGGFGGMGLHVARWLAAQGARHLVLAGRAGPSADPAAREALQALRDGGVDVLAVQADVARADDVAALLQRIAAGPAPLGGIVHAAGVFADRLVVDQAWPLFEQVFAPKVVGAWNLHRLTRGLALDFFALCASASTLFGGGGLSNYVAANEFLDALAAHRRALGLPGVSIAWGPWGGVGMARHVGGPSGRRLGCIPSRRPRPWPASPARWAAGTRRCP